MLVDIWSSGWIGFNLVGQVISGGHAERTFICQEQKLCNDSIERNVCVSIPYLAMIIIPHILPGTLTRSHLKLTPFSFKTHLNLREIESNIPSIS